MQLPLTKSTIPLFVECLESHPNIHTLEIPRAGMRITGPPERAPKRIELPQVKTLIIPPPIHILLRHCNGVEDVVRVVRYMNTKIPSERILSSLVSNRDSKVERLATPWFCGLIRRVGDSTLWDHWT